MDSNLFMGLLIGALVILFGLALTISTLIVKPIIQLNRNMVALDASIKNLNATANVMENRLNKHGEEIDSINRDLRTFEGRVSRLEGGKK